MTIKLRMQSKSVPACAYLAFCARAVCACCAVGVFRVRWWSVLCGRSGQVLRVLFCIAFRKSICDDWA